MQIGTNPTSAPSQAMLATTAGQLLATRQCPNWSLHLLSERGEMGSAAVHQPASVLEYTNCQHQFWRAPTTLPVDGHV
jgi:hypothetical protein